MALPEGWTEGKADDGRVYYQHATVGTTWTRPLFLPPDWTAELDAVRILVSAGRASSCCSASSWADARGRGCFQGSGNLYYKNAATGATSWEAPPGATTEPAAAAPPPPMPTDSGPPSPISRTWRLH